MMIVRNAKLLKRVKAAKANASGHSGNRHSKSFKIAVLNSFFVKQLLEQPILQTFAI
jgi:hypothetical protein